MNRHWGTEELIDFWTLLPPDLEILANKTGATRLGFAGVLKFFAFIEWIFERLEQMWKNTSKIISEKSAQLTLKLIKNKRWNQSNAPLIRA